MENTRSSSIMSSPLLEKVKSKVNNAKNNLTRRRTSNGGGAMTNGNHSKLLKGTDRNAIMNNMHHLVKHLRGRVSAEDMLWDSTTTPSSDSTNDAKTIVGSIEKGGCEILLQSLQYYTKETISLVIKLGLQSSDNPIIPATVCLQLASMKDPANIEGLKACLGAVPDLPLLAHLCTLLNSVGTPKQKLSYTFGPLVFLPRFDNQGVKNLDHEIYAKMDVLRITTSIIRVMEVLITSSAQIFVDIDLNIESYSPKKTSRVKSAKTSLVKSISRARIEYEFKGENPGEIDVFEGEILEVLEQGSDGWWLGQAPDGRKGLFPADYAVIIETEEYVESKENDVTILAEEEEEENGQQEAVDDDDDDDDDHIPRPRIPAPKLEPEEEPKIDVGTSFKHNDQVLKNQIAELTQDLARSQKESDSLQVEIRELRRRNVKLEEDVSNLRKSVNTEGSSRNVEISSLRSRCETAEAHLATMQASEAVLKRELADVQSKSKQAHAEVNCLKGENSSLKTRVEDLTYKLDQKNQRISDVEEEMANLRLELQKAKEEARIAASALSSATAAAVSATSFTRSEPEKRVSVPNKPPPPRRPSLSTTQEEVEEAPVVESTTAKCVVVVEPVAPVAVEAQVPAAAATAATATATAAAAVKKSGFGFPMFSADSVKLKKTGSSLFGGNNTDSSESASTNATSSPTPTTSSRISWRRKSSIDSSAATVPATAATASDPNQAKYDKMRKMGLPEEAILHAMAKDKAANGDSSPAVTAAPRAPPAVPPTRPISVRPSPAIPVKSAAPPPPPSSSSLVTAQEPVKAAPFRLPVAPVTLKSTLPANSSPSGSSSGNDAMSDLQKALAKRLAKTNV